MYVLNKLLGYICASFRASLSHCRCRTQLPGQDSRRLTSCEVLLRPRQCYADAKLDDLKRNKSVSFFRGFYSLRTFLLLFFFLRLRDFFLFLFESRLRLRRFFLLLLLRLPPPELESSELSFSEDDVSHHSFSEDEDDEDEDCDHDD